MLVDPRLFKRTPDSLQRVKSHSMRDDGIFGGDPVAVQRADTADSGTTVVAWLRIDSVLLRHPTSDEALVLIGGPFQRRELVAVNRAAAGVGLLPGIRLAAARAIVPGFVALEYVPAHEVQGQRFLAAWSYRFSSQVWAGWPNAIVLEVRGSFFLSHV